MGVLVRHTVPDFLFLEGTIIGLLELFLIAVGLSMDAFAVSVCKGLSTQTLQRRHYLIVGAWFGGFQALMPTLGYLLGSTFEQYITSVDHWVAFILLSVIGGNMLKEAFSKDEETADASFAPRVMLLLAVPPASMHWRWVSPSPYCRGEYRGGGAVHRLHHLHPLRCGPESGQRLWPEV